MKNSRDKPMLLPDGENVFSAPWHCELFAITISLYEKNVFDWEHWTKELGNKLKDKPVGITDDLDYYYSSWLEALEELIIRKEMTCLDDIKREVSSQMKHLRDDHH